MSIKKTIMGSELKKRSGIVVRSSVFDVRLVSSKRYGFDEVVSDRGEVFRKIPSKRYIDIHPDYEYEIDDDIHVDELLVELGKVLVRIELLQNPKESTLEMLNRQKETLIKEIKEYVPLIEKRYFFSE